MKRRTFLRLAAGAAVLPAASRIASAQAWPARNITLIVPFAPGGATDVSARLVAEHMTRTLGQQVVIQNLAGAGGTTGSTRAMRSEPDGYTILMGHVGTHAVAPSLYAEPRLQARCRFRADRSGQRISDADRGAARIFRRRTSRSSSPM